MGSSRPTAGTKWPTSAIWTPTSTPPSASERALSASSTSVHLRACMRPGLVMLHGRHFKLAVQCPGLEPLLVALAAAEWGRTLPRRIDGHHEAVAQVPPPGNVRRRGRPGGGSRRPHRQLGESSVAEGLPSHAGGDENRLRLRSAQDVSNNCGDYVNAWPRCHQHQP